jgi:hypothetical protein
VNFVAFPRLKDKRGVGRHGQTIGRLAVEQTRREQPELSTFRPRQLLLLLLLLLAVYSGR